MWPFLAAVTCTIAGLAMAMMALRGRRRDTHPVCRRCRFDLIGLTGPAVCPECGAGLAARGAVRRGNRVPRPWALGLGVTLLAAGMWGSWRWGSRMDWMRLMPDSWLVWLATRTPGSVPPSVNMELLGRIIGPSGLSNSDLERLALGVKRDLAADGPPGSRDLPMLVLAAVELGRAPPGMWDGVVRAGTRFEQVVETGAPPTDRWPVELHIIHDRLDDGGSSVMALIEAKVDGVVVGAQEPRREGGSLFSGAGVYRGQFERWYLAPGAGPGRHVLSSTYHVTRRWMQPGVPPVQWTVEIETPFDVAPEGSVAYLIRPVPLDAPKPDLFLLSPTLGLAPEGGLVPGQVIVAVPPRRIAFAVWARSGSGSMRIGSLAAEPTDPPGPKPFGSAVPWSGDGPVDLVFRYDMQVAEEAFGPRTIAWSGEVIFFAVRPVPAP